MVPSLPVFGLMVNGAAFHLYLSGGKVPLKIGAVVGGIPETEFHKAEDIQMSGRSSRVADDQAVDLTGIMDRNKGGKFRLDTVFQTGNDRISQTVPAGVGVQFCLRGLPARIPDRVSVFDVVIASAVIQRAVVVTVPGQAKKFGVFIERVSSGRVGDQAEKILRSQIIDPRERRARRGDDIFFPAVIKMSELHGGTSCIRIRFRQVFLHYRQY